MGRNTMNNTMKLSRKYHKKLTKWDVYYSIYAMKIY